MNRDMTLSLIRSLLITVGTTFAVSKGWVSASGLEAIVGGLVAIAAAVWGVWEKRT